MDSKLDSPGQGGGLDSQGSVDSQPLGGGGGHS